MNGSVGILLTLSLSAGVSLGTTGPVTSRLRRLCPPTGHVLLQRQVHRGGLGRALGPKVAGGEGRPDFSKQKAGPWEMYNLRTPMIILLFFL